jgi:hypothetical protein
LERIPQDVDSPKGVDGDQPKAERHHDVLELTAPVQASRCLKICSPSDESSLGAASSGAVPSATAGSRKISDMLHSVLPEDGLRLADEKTGRVNGLEVGSYEN